jgi:hypothetical protein
MAISLSLLEVLAQVPDPRCRRGRRHPLTAILSLAVLAMLTGCHSYTAIAQFGRDKGFALAHALGFRRGKTPTTSTFSLIFRALDVVAFEAALSRWVATHVPAAQESTAQESASQESASQESASQEELHVCLDGKTARGSKDGQTPGQHLVAAYAPAAQAVLAQIRVDAKTNEHKAALQLLGIVPVQGRVLTGDAMFCQRDVCAHIIAAGGDYLFFVKDNQPSLATDIRAGLGFEAQARQLAAAFSPRQSDVSTSTST